MTHIETNLTWIKNICDQTINELHNNVRIAKSVNVGDLIEKCIIIDERYKQYCDDIDEANDEECGSSYKNGGISMEFYLEADEWHDVSMLLRKLNNGND